MLRSNPYIDAPMRRHTKSVVPFQVPASPDWLISELSTLSAAGLLTKQTLSLLPSRVSMHSTWARVLLPALREHGLVPVQTAAWRFCEPTGIAASPQITASSLKLPSISHSPQPQSPSPGVDQVPVDSSPYRTRRLLSRPSPVLTYRSAQSVNNSPNMQRSLPSPGLSMSLPSVPEPNLSKPDDRHVSSAPLADRVLDWIALKCSGSNVSLPTAPSNAVESTAAQLAFLRALLHLRRATRYQHIPLINQQQTYIQKRMTLSTHGIAPAPFTSATGDWRAASLLEFGRMAAQLTTCTRLTRINQVCRLCFKLLFRSSQSYCFVGCDDRNCHFTPSPAAPIARCQCCRCLQMTKH
jgi:hypothetical protein